MSCTHLTPLACHPVSFPTLVAPAVITVPERHSPCLHMPPAVWGTFPGPGSPDRGSPWDRDIERGKRPLKRRGCPPWKPGRHEVSPGLSILSSVGTGLHPPSQGRHTGLSSHVREALCTVASQLACPPQQASQVMLAGLGRSLVAIPKFPTKEGRGRLGQSSIPRPWT